MESQTKRYSLRPLPGGRRGASGADAGCHSMRTVGDGGLNRRVPLDKYTTAEPPSSSSSSPRSSTSPSNRSLFSNIPSPTSSNSLFRSPNSSPSSTSSSRTTRPTNAVQEALAICPAPIAGPSRARKKWTYDMNRFIWRTYLIITKCETTQLNNYLEPLHLQFINKYPEMQVSRQRIGDQRRAILRSKLLSQDILDAIRCEVEEQIQTDTRTVDNSLHIHNLNPPARSPPIPRTSTRMKWSKEINEDIVLCYFEVTEIERDLTAYRKKLYELFVEKHPHLSHLTEQRIADQRRLLFNNKIFENRIKELKIQVELKLAGCKNTLLETTPQSLSTDTAHVTALDTLPVQPDLQTDTQLPIPSEIHLVNNNNSNVIVRNDIDVSMIEREFDNAILRFHNTDPEERPYIPKQHSSRKFSQIVQYINSTLLPKHLNNDLDFTSLHTIIYSAAYAAATCNGTKFNLNRTSIGERKPYWQIRIERRIEKYRLEIGRLTQYTLGNRTQRILKTVEEIKTKYKIHSRHEEPNTEPQHFLDTLKQKLNVASNRLKRYVTCSKRKQQNKIFSNNEKLFYRTLGKNHQNNPHNSSKIPSSQDLRQFWANIWENPAQHNINADWLQGINNTTHINQMDFDSISVDRLTSIINRTHNWKAPGTDKIHNYWYKKLTCTHPLIQYHIMQFIQFPHTIPSFITNGVTYMLSKGPDQANPANYRPITCLQTIYKIITGCISEIIYEHIEDENILAEQQKGCRKNSQGCKEQLTIDAVVMKQAHAKNRNIHTAYIDYKKAFDSVPHSWLIYALEHYKVHPKVIAFLKVAMAQWKTKLKLNHHDSTITTDMIKIQRGIFQGDALSPLWFCIALNPLSELLNNTKSGFKLNNNNSQYTISHLMYMDDIKIYATNNKELNKLVDITHSFSTDIQMQFGVDKCRIQSIIRGKTQNNSYPLNTGELIESMDENSTYKYLGFHQSKVILQKQAKLEMTQKFKLRLNQILRSQLNSRNTIKAINTYAVPILTYSFGIINWSKSDLIKLQRIINTLLTKHRKHHPKSCTQRLTLSRRNGGRGLIHISNLHNNLITKLRHYFHTKAESVELHKYIAEIDKKLTPLNLHDRTNQPNQHIITIQNKLDTWSQKSLHGRHFADLSQIYVDKEASNEWLRRGELFPETEAFMAAIQDQVINTRNYQKHIIRRHTLPTDICRRCYSSSETIQHITGACKSIAQTDYKHRHDQVASIIHQSLAFKYSLITHKVPYYKYKPASILESPQFKLYWDRTVITDKTIHFNRPDILLHDKSNSIVYLIDIAIPNTHNLASTHSEKIAKYTDLSIELKSQWRVQTVKTIPIVLSSTGVIPHTLHTSLKSLGMHKLSYILLQKATILNTCRIVRKFLSIDQS